MEIAIALIILVYILVKFQAFSFRYISKKEYEHYHDYLSKRFRYYCILIDDKERKKFIKRMLYMKDKKQFYSREGTVISEDMRILFSAAFTQITFGYDKGDQLTDTEEEEVDGIKIVLKDQVFHLPESKYNYDDAKAICKAYGARLATYDDLNNAYNKGADWCSYGWSADQMALFPTQKEKWDMLQKIKGHEQDCGRPGINGGYIYDLSMAYGVNCYGSKPTISKSEADLMRQRAIYNKTNKELKFDDKVSYWRSKLKQIELAPFNHDNWSML